MSEEKTRNYPPLSSQMNVGFSAQDRAFKSLMKSVGGLRYGRLSVILPDGTTNVLSGSEPGPSAVIQVHSFRLAKDVIFGGHVGAAEAYMRGDWDSPDLTALLQVASLNEQVIDEPWAGNFFLRFLGRIKHMFNSNTKRGSKRNISYHYDLGNSFYSEWLDPTMTYSAAWFDDGVTCLETAQNAKYARLARLADVKPGDKVLEIGCGWGGFAEIAARDFGANVTGLTLSREQLAYANRRLQAAGLGDKARMELLDYRDADGQYDAIVSIEMFEAVGERNWPTYFQKVYDRLKPGGKAALQVITIEDHRFPAYRKGADFIQRDIFPGGMLPCPSILTQRAEEAGLKQVSMDHFGLDYADTLKQWQIDFQHAWDRISTEGFDTRFKRMWEYYLSYCEAGFRAGAIDVVHVTLAKPA
jgi:cyclopropane-fatty-acyl-phospholipid synthase